MKLMRHQNPLNARSIQGIGAIRLYHYYELLTQGYNSKPETENPLFHNHYIFYNFQSR